MVALKPRELTRWSGNTTANRRGVGLAAIHESVGLTDAASLAAYCERTGTSYHAVADNGQMIYTVPRSLTAWHIRNGNPYADGLCLATPSKGYSRNEWLGPQVQKVSYAAWWIAGVCTDRNVKIERCSQNDIRAVLAGDTKRGGVIGHVDYTYATGDGTHTDPRNFPFDVAIQWAKDFVRGGSPTPIPVIENKKDNDMHLELPSTTSRKDFQVLFGPAGGWDGDAVLHLAANTGPQGSAKVYWIGAITNRGSTAPLVTDLLNDTKGHVFTQWWSGIYSIPKGVSGLVIAYQAPSGMTGCIERSK